MKRIPFAAALVCAGLGTAQAADLSFDPRIELVGVYNDNYRLSENPDNEIQVTGARLDALVAMRAETQRSRFELTPRLRSSRFPSDEDEEADDVFVHLLAETSTERMRARLLAAFSDVAIRGRYFPGATLTPDDVLGEPDRGEGIGRIALSDREDRFSVSPSLAFDLNERRSMEFSATYLDVSSDVQVPGDRVDYTDLSGAIGVSQALSERSSVTVRLGMGSYEPDGQSPRDAYGLDAEWRRNISEASEVFVRGGMYRAEDISATGNSSDWDSGFTGGAGVRWGFERTNVWLEVDQSLDPNSSGSLVSRQQLRAQLRRNLSEVAGFTVGARYIRDSGTDSDEDFRDATYAAASIGFDWRLTRKWTLVGSYDYQWREDAPRDAKSTAVSLGIVYEPNRR